MADQVKQLVHGPTKNTPDIFLKYTITNYQLSITNFVFVKIVEILVLQLIYKLHLSPHQGGGHGLEKFPFKKPEAVNV